MATCLNEECLNKLLKKLIEKRKFTDDGICVSCYDIHRKDSRCQCDNDE